MPRTLVISSDKKLVDHVEPTLRKLEFEMDWKPSVADGIDKMRYERYSALVVDCEAGPIEEVHKSRDQWLKRDSTVIAVAPQGSSTYERVLGVDTLWSQPLMEWEVYRTLLDVRTREVGDRRLRNRFTLPRATALRYTFDGTQYLEATIADITETGVAIEVPDEIATGAPLQIQFKLPGMLGVVDTFAEVVWRCGHRAGLRFLQLPEQQQRRLERWLKNSRQGLSTGYSYAWGN